MTLFWAEHPELVRLRDWLIASAGIPALGWLLLGAIVPRVLRHVPAERWKHAARARRYPDHRRGARRRAGARRRRVLVSRDSFRTVSPRRAVRRLGRAVLPCPGAPGDGGVHRVLRAANWTTRCSSGGAAAVRGSAIAAAVWIAAGRARLLSGRRDRSGGRGSDRRAAASSTTRRRHSWRSLVPLAELAGRHGGAGRADTSGRPSLARLAFQRIALPATIVLLLATMAWANVRATRVLDTTRSAACAARPRWCAAGPLPPGGRRARRGVAARAPC